MKNEQISTILEQLNLLDTNQGLAWLADNLKDRVCFSTSFSQEDQVITHKIFSNQLAIEVFTLDTGRLFPETYTTWSNTVARYKTPIIAYYFENKALESFISNNGPNSFYLSPERRRQCCHIRKVEPLQRAIANKQVWITGLRKEHSIVRQNLPVALWDEDNQIIKYNPLLAWSNEQVESFIKVNAIPTNVLYERGFTSIGCAPCTRAVEPGEDIRSGRWWWEQNSSKECGLHKK